MKNNLLSSAFLRLKAWLPSRIDFDPDWYLSQYPDVAVAGINPWHHFYIHGHAEGRLPSSAFAKLWSGEDEAVIGKLHQLLNSKNSYDSNFAAWTLGRWYAMRDQWDKVQNVMQFFKVSVFLSHATISECIAPALLWIDALRYAQQFESARANMDNLLEEQPLNADLLLTYANVLKTQREVLGEDFATRDDWLFWVNRIFVAQGLTPLIVKHSDLPISIDNLSTESVTVALPQPLVTVIVPAYNAQATLPTVLRCLQEQTWSALEIIVVDDASSDGTANIVKEFSSRDSRIQLVSQAINQGSYAARNKGLSLAKGEFITVHDSDDWSHPEKIERQAKALMSNKKTMVTLSHLTRAYTDLNFGGWVTPESWTGWVHRNVSSLMMRRKVFEVLGYWDRVKCGADTEYYYRVIKAFGPEAVQEVLPNTPLSFGRLHQASMTQRSETNIFSIFGGVRKQYQDAFHQWHAQARDKSELFMPEKPEVRPFPVPSSIQVL